MDVIAWIDDRVRFLDQTKLPLEEHHVVTDDYHVVADAIRRLAVRGAPLIGIAAAYGAALAVRRIARDEPSQFEEVFDAAVLELEATRPTAVNLTWALKRIRFVVSETKGEPISRRIDSVLREARAIHYEDRRMCESIANHGASLLSQKSIVITHCNTGALATGGRGTALGIIHRAWELGKIAHVYIDETRPLLQGARLTAWELGKLGIPHTLIIDSTAAFVMQKSRIDGIIVGADRIAPNGDVANKIGTYALGVMAEAHRVPFFVAAPGSTIDWGISTGEDIPIEVRRDEEITHCGGSRIAPEGTSTYAPAFDLTPNRLISAIVTDRGVCRAPYGSSLRVHVKRVDRGHD